MTAAGKNRGTPLTAQSCDKSRAELLAELIVAKNQELSRHPYFELCRSGRISRAKLLEVLKQLYCFSTFYERLIRDSAKSPHVAAHILREEFDSESDASLGAEFAKVSPKAFTKAMFGYLSLSVQDEHPGVASIFVLRVMEGIAQQLFRETLRAALAHSEVSSETAAKILDERYRANELEQLATCDAQAFTTCRKLINDVYRLLELVLDEWLGLDPRRELSQRSERANGALRLN